MSSAPRPLAVAIVDEVPLVVAGLIGMLAPYDERVRVLVVDAATSRPLGADLALVDPLGPTGPLGARLDLASARRRSGSDKAVGYSWDLDPALVRTTLAAGADGFLGKTLGAADLVDGLERLTRGETVVTAPPRPDYDALDLARLTPREAEIVSLITAGLSNQEIADRRYLSINSVKSYIRSSYRKMGVSSRSQAVLWGVEHGLRTDRAARTSTPEQE